MPRGRKLAAGALALALAAGIAIAGLMIRGGAGAQEREWNRLLAELDGLRAAAEACLADLADGQERFERYDQRMDSLRAAITAYESAERTVPADQFDSYMAVFDEYNDAVPGWHELADALQTGWDTCYELVINHNELADSASALRPAPPPTYRTEPLERQPWTP